MEPIEDVKAVIEVENLLVDVTGGPLDYPGMLAQGEEVVNPQAPPEPDIPSEEEPGTSSSSTTQDDGS